MCVSDSSRGSQIRVHEHHSGQAGATAAAGVAPERKAGDQAGTPLQRNGPLPRRRELAARYEKWALCL